MSFKSKFRDYFAMDEHVEEYERVVDDNTEGEKPTRKARNQSHVQHTQPKDTQQSVSSQANVVSLQSAQKSSKMVLMEPRSDDEAQQIADHLKNRKAVIINMQRLPDEQARHMVHFLSGTVYAISGDIHKLGTNIFLCTPDNVEISGNITEMISNEFDRY
ncbi:cell division protein SepF [Alkalicoccobacillus murimartini]|uniref:Cell division protein SepF n=1 Tax=Alkalicoccobacillus murimartini TaxID=171685 RepID=A0ABT9YF08_9BACI|nr:cell division protein SepF [Alkalicoccobacillus murimartini]MDQ0206433.1 cell division inhibitor SepF [Alkalicoccobacillus murimartini]